MFYLGQVLSNVKGPETQIRYIFVTHVARPVRKYVTHDICKTNFIQTSFRHRFSRSRIVSYRFRPKYDTIEKIQESVQKSAPLQSVFTTITISVPCMFRRSTRFSNCKSFDSESAKKMSFLYKTNKKPVN